MGRERVNPDVRTDSGSWRQRVYPDVGINSRIGGGGKDYRTTGWVRVNPGVGINIRWGLVWVNPDVSINIRWGWRKRLNSDDCADKGSRRERVTADDGSDSRWRRKRVNPHHGNNSGWRRERVNPHHGPDEKLLLVEVLLYVHRNRRLIRDAEPKTATSTFTQLLLSSVTTG